MDGSLCLKWTKTSKQLEATCHGRLLNGSSNTSLVSPGTCRKTAEAQLPCDPVRKAFGEALCSSLETYRELSGECDGEQYTRVSKVNGQLAFIEWEITAGKVAA